MDAEWLWEADINQSSSTERFPDSHLQSPIRTVYRAMIHKPPGAWPPFIAGCLSRFPIPLHLVSTDSEHQYGSLFSCVYSNLSDHKLQWVYDNYPECAFAVAGFLQTICSKLQLTHIKTRTSPTDKDMSLISQKVIWDDIRTQMQEKRLTADTWSQISQLPYGVVEMKICSQFALLKHNEAETAWHAFDYDQIMMISDTIASRVFCIIYNDMLPEELPGKLPSGLLEQIYKVYDDLFAAHGNLAYTYIARWEPVCMAILLKMHDRLKKSSDYYEWLTSTLASDSDHGSQSLMSLLSEQMLSAECLAELHGIYRHWGHPTVNEELGCEKVRNIAQNRPVPDATTLLRLGGAIKRQFITSFVGKHGRWPRISNVDDLQGRAIHKLASSQSLILNMYSPEYPLEDWGLLRFGKEFEFDYHPDYTDLMDDRSISVKRSEIRSLYSSDALGYKTKRPSTDRRVLRETLKRSTIDVKRICDMIQRGEIPQEWLIIIVHAKERELKIAPRLFAMMTFDIRLYFSITEVNIKEKIFPYFPQQTMTLDEADLSKRLFTLTTAFESGARILSALLGIDFSSWNLCWTFLSTFPIFQFLDDIFGTPGLYFQSHQIFEQSLIALASHHNPPSSLISHPKGNPEECNELWYNHRGGFEGLRQKGWTLCTIGLLLLVEASTGLKSYIIGQGDNQVCKLMIPVPEPFDSVESYICSGQEEITERIHCFSNILFTLAADIGLHVKLDETWVGMDILTYGKEILYKGAFMPQGLKRISRLLTDVNEIYPTLYTKISTLQTAGMACSQKSYDICTPYFLSTVEVLMVVLRDILHMHSTRYLTTEVVETSKTLGFKQFLLCLSSDVGSCPLLSFLSFLYRGHPDPLTTYTTWLRVIGEEHPIAAHMYLWLCGKRYRVGRGDCELLVSNPCSLNIESPEMLSTKLRRDLETALIAFTRNRDLKEIFSSASKSRDENLFKYLLSTEPCHPRIAHEIFRNTITGTKLSFLSKFSNTRTTQTIFGETHTAQNMSQVVLKMEKALIEHWITLYRSVRSVSQATPIIACPTKLAQILRDDSWTSATKGLPIEGVTIPHPFHQFEALISTQLEDHVNLVQPRISYMIPSEINNKLLCTRGPYPAYVGSTTREKRTGRMYTIPQASRPLKSASRLIQLRDWVATENGRLFDFMTQTAESRTNVPVDVLRDTVSPIIGGSVTHRLDDHVTKRGTLHNFRPNITTQIYYSTDTMGRMSQGSLNFNMHFQGAIHLGMSIIQLGVIHEKSDSYKHTSLVYTADCCEEILYDFLLETPESFSPTLVSENNPLLYARVGEIPPSHAPDDSTIIKFVRSARPAEAIAAVLFSRFLSSASVYQIGAAERVNPLIGTIGVAEILGAGLKDIFHHLAKYMMLYLPMDKTASREFLHAMNPHALSDIATICLLPSLLPELDNLLGFSSAPEMFCNKDLVCRLLARVVERNLMTFEADVERLVTESTTTIYYPSTQIGFKRILGMWRKQLWISTRGGVDVLPYINEVYQQIPPGDTFPSAQFVQSTMVNLLKDSQAELLIYICQLCPLKLSSLPAQAVARDSRGLQLMRSYTRLPRQKVLKSQQMKLMGYTTPYVCTFPCAFQMVELEMGELRPGKSLSVNIPKTRLDQTFRLHGTISTAFLKIYEILILEGIQLSKAVVTLAEGEGSIADLLIRMGATEVYYNTLVDRGKLVEQRAPGLVPTCLARDPTRVKMGDMTALTGGDLCDNSVVRSIINYIDDRPIDLVTCDAESSANFAPHIANRILLAWMAICCHTQAPYGIFKSFCHNPDALASTCSSARLIYKSVQVVVPCFSSNETYEVYLVCKEPHDLTSAGTILYAHRQNLVLRTQSYSNLIVSLRNFKTDRVADDPLQDQRMSFVHRVWGDCVNLNISDNAESNLNRITLFNCLYTGQPILDWISEMEELIYQRALKAMSIHSSSYYGLLENQIKPIYTPKHHVLHSQLENYITSLINLRVVKEILPLRRNQITESIKLLIGETYQLKQGKTLLYSYRVDYKIWSKAYLKSICRVWGHRYHQNNHACTINWTGC